MPLKRTSYIIKILDAKIGNNWQEPDPRLRLGAWAYHAYRIEVDENRSLSFSIRKSKNDNPLGEFRGQVVQVKPTGKFRYDKLPFSANGNDVSKTVPVEAENEVYFVVANTSKKVFTDDTMIFSYQFKIE